MLYKDPIRHEYPIKSYSLVASALSRCNPRLLQIFFSKKFNISIRRGIVNTNDKNHKYGRHVTFRGGILTLGCLLWTGLAGVEYFKSLLSCKDMDLSKQINQSLFFDVIGNDYLVRLATDNYLPKMLSFFLCKTWNNSWNAIIADNKNRRHVINDESNNSKYIIRDIYATKLGNIDIIHARDKNGDSLFYKCVENRDIKLNTLKFLYEYAIEMNKQFPEKYSQHDVYYFVNNINPNILLNKNYKNNKKEQVTKQKFKGNKLRVISNAAINVYSSINFDQFNGEYYGKRHSTFMVACKNGYCTKIQFLIDYCQWFIDLTLRGWNHTEKQYFYASDLAIIHNELYDEHEMRFCPEISRVSEKLLQWISWMEVGYQDYGMKISFQFLLHKLVINNELFCCFFFVSFGQLKDYMNNEPYGKFFMEYNIDFQIQNPRLNDNYKIHKKCDKKSRMAAKKKCAVKKYNRKRERVKLKMDTKAMIADIFEYY